MLVHKTEEDYGIAECPFLNCVGIRYQGGAQYWIIKGSRLIRKLSAAAV
jgi:hypothetical protein